MTKEIVDPLEAFASRMGFKPARLSDHIPTDRPIMLELARQAGVDLDALRHMDRETQIGLTAAMRAVALLPPYGWAVAPANVLRMRDYVDVVELVDQDAGQEAIDARMTTAWNVDDYWIPRSVKMVHQLIGTGEDAFQLITARRRLLNQAAKHHVEGQYAAAILIVLSQIDGLTLDIRGEHGGAFHGAKADDFLDDQTVAGMPGNLRMVWLQVRRPRNATAMTGRLERHPIMHGRELDYASKVNSTKVFALLRATMEWLQPQAKSDEVPAQ